MNPSDSIGTETMLSEIQARHDRCGEHPIITAQIGTDAHYDRAWLLSDRKRLEKIIEVNAAYCVELQGRVQQQETEIRLLREVVNAYTDYEDLGCIDEARVDLELRLDRVRGALAEFDKSNLIALDKN